MRLREFYALGKGESGRRRQFFAGRLHGVTRRIERSLQRKEDTLDRLFQELDKSVARSRRVMQHRNERVGPGEWDHIRSTAIARDSLDCPICMSELQREVTRKEPKPVVVLKCTHVFHRQCL